MNACNLCFLRFLVVLLKSLLFMFIILQALFREGHIPAQFDDISYLAMNITSWDDDVVSAMVSLMKGMPNLNTLNLKSNHSINVPKPEVLACALCISLSHPRLLCCSLVYNNHTCVVSRMSQ